MSITATEFKTNFSNYQDRLDIAESLFGSVPATMTLDEAEKERLDNIKERDPK
jgi:hypothetical protein